MRKWLIGIRAGLVILKFKPSLFLLQDPGLDDCTSSLHPNGQRPE